MASFLSLGLTFLGGFAGQMFIVDSELINKVSEVLRRRRLHSLHKPVESALNSGVFSVGNGNVKKGFESWN